MIVDCVKNVMNVRTKMTREFITKAHYPDDRVLRLLDSGTKFMGDSMHPPKSDLVLLYEVVDTQGRALWGGEDEIQAINWMIKHSIVDQVRLLVSAWDSDEEDAHLVGQSIDITGIVLKAFKKGLLL
jgi:hypothetical protein